MLKEYDFTNAGENPYAAMLNGRGESTCDSSYADKEQETSSYMELKTGGEK